MEKEQNPQLLLWREPNRWKSGCYPGSLLVELGCHRPSTSFPPPCQADLCLTRGDTGIAVHLRPAARSRAENLAASPGRRQEPTETPRPSHRSQPASPRTRSRKQCRGVPKACGYPRHPFPSPIAWLSSQRPELEANFSRTPPPRQTASLGDATVCAVPLKAAGSVLPFSTGCQNMQIRGPESAAK
jgi:hypothetical protein